MLPCIRSMTVGLVMVVWAEAAASAQHVSPVGIVRASATAVPLPDSPAAPSMRVQPCAAWNIIGFAAGGAAFGYLVGSVQPFASDTGRLYQEHRRKVMLIGAALGATIGVVAAARGGCFSDVNEQGHR